MKPDTKDAGTGHKAEPAPTNAGTANPEGSLPMGMTGASSEGDPDQKSTHNAPKTVESNLPDGSPKYADAGKAAGKKAAAKAGKYEVVSRITTKRGDAISSHEAGDIVELEADEAESLGESIKPAR